MNLLKKAFLQFKEQRIFSEILHDCIQMFPKGAKIGGKLEDIIQVYHHADTKEVIEYIINGLLEDDQSITEPKWHGQVLKVSILSAEHCLPSVTFSNVDQIVDSSQIEDLHPD